MVETGASASHTGKLLKYEECYNELENLLKKLPSTATEQQKQKLLCEVLDRAFKETWNFVGFYDLRPEVHPNKLFIGEFVSALVFPCGEIEIGKGQCGQCVSEERVMIAYDVSKLENYIACDDDTQSEIVVPCFVTVDEEDDEEAFMGESGGTGGSKKRKVRKLRTVLDIDSTRVGNFDEEDQRGLEKIITLIYH